MTAGARDFLKARGTVLDTDVTDRQSYAEAMLGGLTGPEKDKTAKGEIAALWQAIRKRLAAGNGAGRVMSTTEHGGRADRRLRSSSRPWDDLGPPLF
jgi:hypothetical protein